MNDNYNTFRLVPRISLPSTSSLNTDIGLLRSLRSRLDFNAREKIGIRYDDMLREAREFFEREGIKDLTDLTGTECIKLSNHLFAEKERIREKYPYWGKG